MKIDTDGYRFFFVFLGAALILGGVYYALRTPLLLWAAILAIAFAVYTLYFFRDPERAMPAETEAAISAADGVVVDVSRVTADGFDDDTALRIAVFMNVFNVHVNRTPLPGTVAGTYHKAGKKLSAFNSRAELENEYGDTDMDTPYGRIRIRQIAGLIARRIVTRVKRGDELEKGARIGLIRFGSRVDVFLPASFEAAVAVGEKVRAGETVIARIARQ